jgi:hypothetical protein
MIAEAVRSAVPDARSVSVDLQTIRFTDAERGLRYVYLTPRIGQMALVDFDQGRLPEPFSMQLRGGQVILSGNRGRRERSPKQVEQSMAALKKAALVKAKSTTNRTVERVGGKAPPVGSFARRRQFGLKALDR